MGEQWRTGCCSHYRGALVRMGRCNSWRMLSTQVTFMHCRRLPWRKMKSPDHPVPLAIGSLIPPFPHIAPHIYLAFDPSLFLGPHPCTVVRRHSALK